MKHSEGFLRLVNAAKALIKQVTVEDVRRRLDAGEQLTLIDVREDREWDEGHLRGATHLARGIIERDIESKFPDKEKELILYCGGGYRSALVADNLQKMGYVNVISMDGGWRRWNELGLPTEK